MLIKKYNNNMFTKEVCLYQNGSIKYIRKDFGNKKYSILYKHLINKLGKKKISSKELYENSVKLLNLVKKESHFPRIINPSSGNNIICTTYCGECLPTSYINNYREQLQEIRDILLKNNIEVLDIFAKNSTGYKNLTILNNIIYLVDVSMFVENKLIQKYNDRKLYSHKVPYQSLPSLGIVGYRDTLKRLEIYRFDNFKNKRVLDLGCCMGVFCQESVKKGSQDIVGIDYDEKLIELNQEYAELSNDPIKYICLNLNRLGFEKIVNLIGTKKFDILFCFSIFKHIDHDLLFKLIKYYCFGVTYFEFNREDNGSRKSGLKKYDKENMENLLKDKLSPRLITYLGLTYDGCHVFQVFF